MNSLLSRQAFGGDGKGVGQYILIKVVVGWWGGGGRVERALIYGSFPSHLEGPLRSPGPWICHGNNA